MATEDLVPVGLPQGGRQQVKAGLQAADLPLDSETAPVAGLGPPTSAPAGVPNAAPPARQQLQNFDVFADRTPNPQAAPPRRDVIFEQGRQSGNAVLQDIYSRVPGFKDD